MTLTGITASNKVYDGTTAATLNTGSVGYSGLVAGDSVSLGGTGVGVFSDKNAGNGKTVTVSGYALGGTDAGNYTVAQPTGLTANITAKSLTATMTTSNKIYDGTVTASPTFIITGGLVGTETVTATGAASFSDKNVGNGKTVTANAVTLADGTNGGLASNYSLAAGQTTTANITARALNGAIGAGSSTYGSALSGGAVTYSNLVSGDSVSATVGVNATGNTSSSGNLKAGTYGSIQSVTGLSGTDGGNYSIGTFSDGGYTVSKLGMTLTGITASNKTYDGTTAATVSTSGASYAGLVSGDSVKVSATGAFSDKNAGTAKTVNLASSYTGADVGNYSITSQASTTANITPVTLDYVAAPTSLLSGQTPSGLTGTVSGFVSNDTLANSTTGTANWTTLATASSPPGSYPIDGSGLSAANYVFAQAAGNATALTLQPSSPPQKVDNVTTTVIAMASYIVLTPSTTITPELAPAAAGGTGTPAAPPPQNGAGLAESGNGNTFQSQQKSADNSGAGSDSGQGNGNESPSGSENKPVVTAVMSIGRTGSTLEIINGGARMPANRVHSQGGGGS